MSIDTTKRTRFDSAALSPSDSPTTPMAAARQSITTSVESLQPEIARILSRLGVELLVCFHKLQLKRNQVKKFDDENFIPISARINFTLKGSKLVEQDEEFTSLAGDTATIVKDFQQSLRTNILSATKMEVNKLESFALDTFAKNLRMAVKALLLCESAFKAEELDKVCNTLCKLYQTQLVSNFEVPIDRFLSTFKRVHSLSSLPMPYITELSVESSPGTQPMHSSLPPQRILVFFPKLWRIVDSVFIQPWVQYLNVLERNNTALQIKALGEEYFTTKSTDEGEMEVDSEPPVDPEILNNLIQKKVDAATKKLNSEVSKLKLALSKAKNSPRDHSGALPKKSGGRIVANTKGSDAASKQTQKMKPKPSSKTKNKISSRASKKSN